MNPAPFLTRPQGARYVHVYAGSDSGDFRVGLGANRKTVRGIYSSPVCGAYWHNPVAMSYVGDVLRPVKPTRIDRPICRACVDAVAAMAEQLAAFREGFGVLDAQGGATVRKNAVEGEDR